MPFAIVCKLCGYDEAQKPITFFRDTITNPAWIPYAQHIVELHKDNFRIYWAMHALDDKHISYEKPKEIVPVEAIVAKVQGNGNDKVKAATILSPLKPNAQTITEYLLQKKRQQAVDTPKTIDDFTGKDQTEVKDKDAQTLLPEDKVTNFTKPPYDESEPENVFTDTISKVKKNKKTTIDKV
jgi:hypothetical protein